MLCTCSSLRDLRARVSQSHCCKTSPSQRTEVCMNRKSERGQALVFAAIGLVALLGFVGLGIDMGTLRYQKRLQQTAADAAALAGATNLPPYSGIQAGAQNAASGNGFAD